MSRLLGATFFGLLGAASGAQPLTPGTAPAPAVHTGHLTLDDLVAGLGSMDFPTRVKSETALRVHPDAVLTRLEDLLQRPDLDPEQRARLSALARDRFGVEPRAALGINFNVGMGNRGSAPAVIAGTLEGFDSARVLQANDAILAFDGNHVTNRVSFRSHILSYDPGDTVRLSVERNDEIIEVHVQMGAQTDLPNDGATQDITDSALNEAWEVRARRKHLDLGSAETLLDSRLSAANWRATWTSAQGALDPREPMQHLNVAGGGEPRGAGADAMREFVGGEFRATRYGRGTVRNLEFDQIRQFERTIEEIDRMVNQIKARMPNVDADQQKTDLLVLARLMQERENLTGRIEMLRGRGRNGVPRNFQPRPR